MFSNEEESCLHGYHLYQNIWTTEVGKSLICEREPLNSIDKYALVVLEENVVVSHLPRQLSRILSLFILRNDTTNCIVTGGRIYSTNSTFQWQVQEKQKIKCLLSLKATSVTNKVGLFL